jgi:hypothetical protein
VLAESQFESIADRALFTAHEITFRKRLGTISMASVAGNVNPDPEKWPFVTILGYEEIATNIIETSDGREMGFCPFVTPEQSQTLKTLPMTFSKHHASQSHFPMAPLRALLAKVYGDLIPSSTQQTTEIARRMATHLTAAPTSFLLPFCSTTEVLTRPSW